MPSLVSSPQLLYFSCSDLRCSRIQISPFFLLEQKEKFGRGEGRDRERKRERQSGGEPPNQHSVQMKSTLFVSFTEITKLPTTEKHMNSQSCEFISHIFSIAYKMLKIIDSKARKMQNVYLGALQLTQKCIPKH